jgi:rSAM/selenodomain-associated transferase 2
VVPVYNEAQALPAVLARLQVWRASQAEVIVMDGGSTDSSVGLARELADRVEGSASGRALQMNAGANLARGAYLLFLHADTELPDAALPYLQKLLAGQPDCKAPLWGRFNVEIIGRSPLLRMVAFMMNWRSRFSGIATGDQALFMSSELFKRVDGFPQQALMEDVEICRRLKRIADPHCAALKVRTSGRRWDANGVWRTIFLMWRLRWLYFRGAHPQDLAALYRASKSR